MRRVERHCALCKKAIYDGEEYVLETDRRGIVTRMYHRKCVMTRRATDRADKEIRQEMKQGGTGSPITAVYEVIA